MPTTRAYLDPIYHEIQNLFVEQQNQTTYLDGRYPEFEVSTKQLTSINNTNVAYFQVADTIFSIDTKDETLFTAIMKLLEPQRCISEKADFVLSIAKSESTYQLFSNGLVVEKDLGFKHVMPVIIERIQILSFQKSDYTCCLHGVAVKMPQGTLLIPGKSGSGKSTLSAVLVNDKGSLFSDEIIAFNKDFELCILSLPIAVKSGSWKSLDIHYPNLNQLPTWHRLDGRRLKYVWPTTLYPEKITNQEEPTQFLLINPNFFAQSNNSIEIAGQTGAKHLNVIDTISMLTESGYQLGFELTETRSQEFLNFISAIPCYQLSYSSSQQALDKLDELWQQR